MTTEKLYLIFLTAITMASLFTSGYILGAQAMPTSSPDCRQPDRIPQTSTRRWA